MRRDLAKKCSDEVTVFTDRFAMKFQYKIATKFIVHDKFQTIKFTM